MTGMFLRTAFMRIATKIDNLAPLGCVGSMRFYSLWTMTKGRLREPPML